MLKRVFIAFALLLSLNLVLPFQAKAVVLDSGLTEAGVTGAGYSTTDDLPATLGMIISIVIGLLGVIFLILTVYAGMLWMTSAGDTKQVEKAKSILVAAVIGLIITLSAYAITRFVLTALSSTRTTITAP